MLERGLWVEGGRGRLTINSFRNRNHQRSGFRVCLAYGNVNRCRNGRYCAPLPPRRNSSVRKLTGHPRKGTKRGISPVSINAAPAFLRVGRTITRALISDGNLLLKKGWFLLLIFFMLNKRSVLNCYSWKRRCWILKAHFVIFSRNSICFFIK